MEENTKESAQSSGSANYWIASFWIISLFLVGILSYNYGKGAVDTQPKTAEKVLGAEANQESTLKAPVANTESTIVSVAPESQTTSSEQPVAIDSKVCGKTGLAQKWEYLTPYTVKQSESLQSIATDQLKDSSRVNELLQLNGVGPLVVGSTIYLPPSNITKSSGNIRLINGKLVEKNDSSWHISFTSDKSGQGLLIPAYLFQTVSNASSFTIGSCISVLLDDGYKVYSVELQ